MAAIVGDAGGGTICANCGDEIDAFADLLPREATVERKPSRTAVVHAHVAAPPHLAHSRARLDHIGRRLESLGRLTSTTRLDAPAKSPPGAPSRGKIPAWISGAGLFLGVASFACGAALAGWSLISERAELWHIGLPLAIAGQAALLAALASQCEFRVTKTAG